MEQAIRQMNEYGRLRQPFYFIIDFEKKKPIVLTPEALEKSPFSFSINQKGGVRKGLAPASNNLGSIKTTPISFDKFDSAFNKVQNEIAFGNSFLCNLTFSTPISIETTIQEIFQQTSAKYKVMQQDEWVSFSPEIFVQIKDNRIFTFPMKGTIDAAIPNAEQIILDDKKETAEHYTIVDLLRNDLALVSENVVVDQFRYIDRITTSTKNLLQVSSRISGELSSNWHEQIGTLLDKLLPAGSISGAPKKKTVEIIKAVENHPEGRDYYTGVAGYYDGQSLDSCVLIRFVYQHENQYYYCSGGGITCNSDARKEYQEMLDKIYFPIV